jgi:hypothetical protein
MTAMHAIKIANGQCAALLSGGNIAILPEYFHQSSVLGNAS